MMSKPKNKCVEAAKSYREGLSKQERVWYFDKLINTRLNAKDFSTTCPAKIFNDPPTRK